MDTGKVNLENSFKFEDIENKFNFNNDRTNDNSNIELIADANATPPLGIGGTDMMDKGNERHGKIVWGAIGFGTLKLAVHKACIQKLFESNDQLLDAEEIFDIAKSMA